MKKTTAKNLMNFIFTPRFIIVASSIFVFNAFAEIPDQTIECKANVFVAVQKLPVVQLAPAKIKLDPQQMEFSAKFNIQKIEYNPQYAAFYSKYGLYPRAEETPWENKIITSSKNIEAGNLEIILRRFDADPKNKRVAAMSLDVLLENSFNASYLIHPESTGSNLTVSIPKTVDTEAILVTVTCEVY